MGHLVVRPTTCGRSAAHAVLGANDFHVADGPVCGWVPAHTVEKSGHVGAVGLDVYEREEEYFFRDASGTIIHDDVFSRLLSFYNVFLTGHQAFLTNEVSLLEFSIYNYLS